MLKDVLPHAADVLNSLERDVFPSIGTLPIASIDAPMLLDLLQQIEKRGAVETAHRLRQRISDIFVYGIAIGVAQADPAATLGRALKRKPRAKPQPAILDLDKLRQMLLDCESQKCRATTKLAMRLSALATPSKVVSSA